MRVIVLACTLINILFLNPLSAKIIPTIQAAALKIMVAIVKSLKPDAPKKPNSILIARKPKTDEIRIVAVFPLSALIS